MSTIVTRAGKGSALTWTEGDANITNLNNDKIEAVVDDTTPQLGGNLDVNGNAITSASNGNIRVEPNGSGNIQLTPTTGKITLGALDFPTGMGTNGQVLTTNGSSAMTWETPSSGGASTLDELSDVVITAAATNDALIYNGTNWVDTALSGVTVGTASVGSTVTLTADDSTNATNYPLFANAATGNLSPRTDTGFTYNPSTGVLTAAGFSGPINGTVGATTPAAGTFTDVTSTGLVSLKGYKETIYAGGSQTSAYTPNYSNGSVHTVTLTGNVTFAAPTNMVAGESMTLILTQDGTGSRLGTWNASYKWLGGTPALSTAAASIDIVNIFYDGTNYITGISKQDTSASVTSLTVTGAMTFKQPIETIYDNGNSGTATITPDAANGSVQKYTLTGNITLNAFGTPVAGQSMTLILVQDATGSRTLTSSMKWAGGTKTLSTAANSIDIATIYYDGTNYYASLGKGFA